MNERFFVAAAALWMFASSGCLARVDGDSGAGTSAAALSGSSAPTGAYECPCYIPTRGYACSGDYSCNIANNCGTTTLATCSGGVWSVDNPMNCGPADSNCVAPGSSSCPGIAPVAGESCWVIAGTSCTYSNTCSGTDTFTCSGGAWNLAQVCAPPCPSALPSAGSACIGTESCTYKDACGNPEYATCSNGAWAVSTPYTCKKTSTTSGGTKKK